MERYPVGRDRHCDGFPANGGDQVTLINGDRISGAVTDSDQESIRITSEFLGGLTVPWEAVAEFLGELPILVFAGDEDGAWRHGLQLGQGVDRHHDAPRATRLGQRRGRLEEQTGDAARIIHHDEGRP